MRVGVGLLILYAAGSVVANVLIDAPTNAAFRLTWRFPAVPIAIVTVAAVYCVRSQLPSRAGHGGRACLTAALLFIVLLITTPAYLLLVNSLGAGRGPVLVAGPVLEKWTRSYKTTSHYVRILDEETGQKTTLQVSPSAYGAVEVGSHFSRMFFRGRLGIPYRWIWA